MASDFEERMRRATKLVGGDPRKTPHLAIQRTTGDNEFLALGSIIYWARDPEHEAPTALVLTKVTKNYLEFKAYSTDKRSTRKVRLNAVWSGTFVSPYKQPGQAQEVFDEGADDEG